MTLRSIVFFIIPFFYGSGYAQYKAAIDFPADFSRKFNKPNELVAKDSVGVFRLVDQLIFQLWDEGYLLAEYSSTPKESKIYAVHIFPGKQFRWSRFSADSIAQDALESLGIPMEKYSEQPISPRRITNLAEATLKGLENEGYPFASVWLDSVAITGEELSAELHLSKGERVVFDTLSITGSANVSPKFVARYIGVRRGRPYKERIAVEIPGRLSEISFIEMGAPPTIAFSDGKAKPRLVINARKANRFDGVLGILPDKITGKIQFTGDLVIQLQNALKQGEQLSINWRKLQYQTQDLKVIAGYPFLLGTPVGLGWDFKLYKRDSTFLTLNNAIEFNWQVAGGSYFRAQYLNKSTSLLATDAIAARNVTPDNADTRYNGYGVGYKILKLDYRPNPRKGYQIDLLGVAGTRLVRTNPKIKPELYDSLQMRSTQYQVSGQIIGFVPLGARLVFMAKGAGASVIGSNLFVAELYRLGGLQTWRGFNEESMFASSYATGILELRYLLEKNSHAAIFVDGGYLEDRSISREYFATPIGAGAGVGFETKAGIFNISYAVGKLQGRQAGQSFDNPLDFRDSKVHFGYVNLF